MFDTEKFICEVEQRPAIYDVKSKGYSDREVRARCWSDIGAVMFEHWDSLSRHEKNVKEKDLMKKWKALRDNFVKDYKLIVKTENGMTASKKKRYVHYDQLLFLLPHVKRSGNTLSNTSPLLEDAGSDANSPDDVEVVSSDETDQTQDAIQGHKVVSPRKKRNMNTQLRGNKRRLVEKTVSSTMKDFTKVLSESVAFQKDDGNPDKYGNKAFLLSFGPVLDSLPMQLMMHARLRITQVINEITCSGLENNSLQYNASSPSTSANN